MEAGRETIEDNGAEHRGRSFRWWPALVALPFAEVGLTVLLTRWIGPAGAYALYAVPALLALLVQWCRYPAVKAIWDEFCQLPPDERRQRVVEPEWGVRFWRVHLFWLTVVLLLVPGVLSHVAALYLLLRGERHIPRWAGTEAAEYPTAPEDEADETYTGEVIVTANRIPLWQVGLLLAAVGAVGALLVTLLHR